MPEEKTMLDTNTIVAQLTGLGITTVRYARSRPAQFAIGLITIGVAAYLVYTNVWTPLLNERTLPPGVTARIPQIEQQHIQQIIAAREERISAVSPAFNISSLFRANATPSQ